MKEGVTTTESGLQYKVITEGTGVKPTEGESVTVHYTGTLTDGTKFDSSVDRNEPFEFQVGQGVIKGWSEIIKEMPVGSKWTVYIPYDLAYGNADRGAIKPYSNLIFDIELISVKPAAKK